MDTEKKSPYFDVQKFKSAIEETLREAVESWDETAGDYVRYMKDCADDYMDEYVDGIIEETIKSFDTYVHRDDTSMVGNFCDIRYDYEREHKGQSFRALIEKIDANMGGEDVDEFREWSVGWYFTAFGTYNLKYNWAQFMEDVSGDCE